MRLRHIPGSEEFVRRASATVNEPERYRGKWSAFFREDAPLALEIGMGKGHFLRELSARVEFPRTGALCLRAAKGH